MASILSATPIENRIILIRGQKVMIDRDLADLYQVETKRLNEQVKRNLDRFPKDFMFQLSDAEFKDWKSQFATSNSDKMAVRRSPYAFTQNGIAMLSSVLNSPRAIHVNIQIMRAFTKLREIMNDHADLRKKIISMEKKYDQRFKIVFDAIREILTQPPKDTKRIGF